MIPNSTFLKTHQILQKNGVIATPTETLWGLSARVSKTTQHKINQLKKSDLDKPLIQLFPNKSWLKKLGCQEKSAFVLAKKFWPGALTILFTNSAQEKIAARVEKNSPAQKLCQKFKQPIFSTSANLSGKAPLNSMEKIIETWDKRVVIFNPNNYKPRGSNSTIVSVIGEQLKLVRTGAIKFQIIAKFFRLQKSKPQQSRQK